MVKIMKKQRFDEEGTEVVPAKNRVFTLKGQAQTNPVEPDDPGPSPQPEPGPPPKTTDTDGLERAYASPTNLYLDPQGTLHVSGTKGGFLGKEWIENYQYFGPGLASKLGSMFGAMVEGGVGVDTLGAGDSYNVESMGRYKEVDDFVRAHPGQVTNFTGHSKGAAVVDKWMKNNPGFEGRARLYNTPYEDITGSEAWKDKFNDARKRRGEYFKDKFLGPSWLGNVIKTVEDKGQDALEEVTGLNKVKGMNERHEQRFAQEWDPASILDTSATVYKDPDWWKKPGSGFGHDYHNVASHFAGFDEGKEVIGNLPSRGARGLVVVPDFSTIPNDFSPDIV